MVLGNRSVFQIQHGVQRDACGHRNGIGRPVVQLDVLRSHEIAHSRIRDRQPFVRRIPMLEARPGDVGPEEVSHLGLQRRGHVEIRAGQGGSAIAAPIRAVPYRKGGRPHEKRFSPVDERAPLAARIPARHGHRHATPEKVDRTGLFGRHTVRIGALAEVSRERARPVVERHVGGLREQRLPRVGDGQPPAGGVPAGEAGKDDAAPEEVRRGLRVVGGRVEVGAAQGHARVGAARGRVVERHVGGLHVVALPRVHDGQPLAGGVPAGEVGKDDAAPEEVRRGLRVVGGRVEVGAAQGGARVGARPRTRR